MIRRIQHFTPEEKEFFNNISKEHDVVILPYINGSDGIPILIFGMRRCINGEHVSLIRMLFNYFNHQELIPKQLPIKTFYDNECNNMYDELQSGNGFKEKQIGGITEWYR